MRGSKYTRAVLQPMVAASRSLTEVVEKLGLRPVAGNYRYIRGRIRVAGIDTSHFVHGSVTRWIRALTYEHLEPIVRGAKSYARVLAKLELPDAGRPLVVISERIRALGIDTRHFTGRAWNRGATAATNPILRRAGQKTATPNELVFIANSPYLKSVGVVRRLLDMGWSYQCDECGIASWRGRKLTLHLEHINGIHNDHRLENLRLLCPNCHSQTETYGNRTRSVPI